MRKEDTTTEEAKRNLLMERIAYHERAIEDNQEQLKECERRLREGDY